MTIIDATRKRRQRQQQLVSLGGGEYGTLAEKIRRDKIKQARMLSELHVQNVVDTIINDFSGAICGFSYEVRCNIARADRADPPMEPYRQAEKWLEMVNQARGSWTSQHANAGAAPMTAAERLKAAAELADYYARHVAEEK